MPIVQAPMAGGPSTPELAAAVSEAGGLGFLAAGYKSPDAVSADLRAVRALTSRPVGLNLFAPPDREADPGSISRYAQTLGAESDRYGVALGEPRFDDDAHAAKLELALRERIAVVSFTFGCPASEVVTRLVDAGIAVWATVTSPAEAEQAAAAGVDALVVQGTEAGGHRAYFQDDDGREEYGLLILLRLVSARTELPLIATGAITDGAAVAAVLCAGAAAAQLGSALMLTPEAATSALHRAQLSHPASTRLTRAFSGRTARGIVNRFMEEHGADAPRAYPQIHHLTAPLRVAAREQGDPGAVNLWAGQGHEQARNRPAADLVREFAAQAAATLQALAERLPDPDG